MNKKLQNILFGSLLVVFSLSVGIILGHDIKKEKIVTQTQIVTQTETIVKEVQPVPLLENCLKGTAFFYSPETEIYIKIGETQICGIDLHTSNVVGPNYDEVINNLENNISHWKDCALYQSCSKEMLEEKK